MDNQKRSLLHVAAIHGPLLFNVHRLLYHSTLGLRVIKRREEDTFRFRTPVCDILRVVRCRVRRAQLKWFSGVLLECQGQNRALTVLCVPYSIDNQQRSLLHVAAIHGIPPWKAPIPTALDQFFGEIDFNPSTNSFRMKKKRAFGR